jgi:hypothetical protein
VPCSPLYRLPAGRERGRDVGDGRGGDTARGQVARGLEVLVAVQQPGLRGRAVPAGPPELLVVRVQRGRRIGVQHPAHVRLVDPHAERDRGHDDAGRAAEERGHRVVPLAPGQPGVVERHPLARFGERVARRLRAGVRRRVDDPRAGEPGRRADKLLPLVGDRARAVHRQADVRPVEVADHHHGITQAEPPHDLLPHRRRGRRGQRQPDRRADRPRLRAEQHVVGPEVVAPLADQVGLVDGEQPRPRALQRLPGLGVGELLRRQEDERARVARGEQRRRACARRLLRVEHDRRQAGRPHMRELVVLQRDQRRDDDRRARSEHPGQLVDRRLPAPGRQHRQHVAAAGQRLRRAQLSRPQLLEAEPLPGRAPRSRLRPAGRHR